MRTYPARLHCILPEQMDAATIRETLEDALRRRRFVRPCPHGTRCVCRTSSTAERYGRRRASSFHVKVRVTAGTADRIASMAARAGVSRAQAIRDLLGLV